MPRSWVFSIYKRMGYKARAGTTSRPPVPFGLFSESRFEYLSSILEIVKQYAIPPLLIFNANQTPCSYVSVGKMMMAKKGDKSIPIKGLTDKRNISLTFVVSFTGEFLPMQTVVKLTVANQEVSSFLKGSMSLKIRDIGPMKKKQLSS